MYCVKTQGWFQRQSFLDLQIWYPDVWTISKTPNVNSFFFDFVQRKLNDQ
jgi:hypothetical protein